MYERDHRALWSPSMSHLYHIPPWQIDHLTPMELDRMRAELDQIAQMREKAAR